MNGCNIVVILLVFGISLTYSFSDFLREYREQIFQEQGAPKIPLRRVPYVRPSSRPRTPAIRVPRSAGFGFRINKPGLDYLGELAANFLRDELHQRNWPDLSDKSGKTRYEVTNIRSEFTLARTTFTTQAPNRFTLSLSRANLRLDANYKASKKVLFIKFKSSGRLTVRASNVDLSVTVALCSRSGKPTITPVSCRANIGEVDIKLRGSILAPLFNFFESIFDGVITRYVERKACDIVNKAIRSKVEKEVTNKWRVNRSLHRDTETLFNAGFVGCSAATSNGVAFYIGARVFNQNLNPRQQYPFTYTALPSFSASTKMAQALLSEYSLNTLLYSYWQGGHLEISLTLEQVLSRFGSTRRLLNKLATDLSGTTIQWPTFRMGFNSSPSVIINRSGITLRGDMKFSVQAPPLLNEYTAVLGAEVVGGIRYNQTEQSLQGSVSHANIILRSIPGLDSEDLQTINGLLRNFLPDVVSPVLDEFVQDGVDIGKVIGYGVRRPTVVMKQHAVEIAADIQVVDYED